MSIIYTSTTGSAVNVGTYVVTVTPGLQVEKAIDELDALVGTSLARTAGTGLDVASAPQEILGTVPVIIPNSSTVATNGDITVTALAAAYVGGAWVHLPAGAVVGGAAGLYWTVFTTTTAGNVKTNFVDPATTEFIPYTPSGAVVSAVGSNGAYVTPTAITPLVNITLPPMSVGSAVKTFTRVTCPNAADAKTVTHSLGTTAIGAQAFTTSTGGTLSTSVHSRTSATQVMNVPGVAAISGTTFGAEDTSVASKLVISGTLAATTGYITLEVFTVTQVIN